MLQLKPPLPGKVSLSVTFLASPGPALLTVIVNAIVSCELTRLASLLSVTERSGHCTVIESEPELLVVLASRSEERRVGKECVSRVAEVVGEEICTALLAPAITVP